MIERKSLESALAALGATLSERGFPVEIVVIGGSGLLLQGFIQRSTRDVDVVAIVMDGRLATPTPLPEPLMEAARDVGRTYGLGDGWLNAGPALLYEFGLPDGLLDRCTTRTFDALTVHIAGRLDLIALKLYASTTVTRHDMDDLRSIRPSHRELLEVVPWVLAHEARRFRSELASLLEVLGIRDADSRI